MNKAADQAVLSDDHWVDPGGQTLEALEGMLTSRLGRTVVLEEVVLLQSVDHMRALINATLIATSVLT